jgi:hypothetical protein
LTRNRRNDTVELEGNIHMAETRVSREQANINRQTGRENPAQSQERRRQEAASYERSTFPNLKPSEISSHKRDGDHTQDTSPR